MKRIAIYITSFFIFISPLLSAITTKEIPNARTLYKKEKKQLNKLALLGTFLPIPVVSTIFQAPKLWSNYLECRKMYKIFKYSFILENKKSFSEKDIIKAEKRIKKLLDKIKEETIESTKKPSLFNQNLKNQQVLTNRILKMSTSDLSKLLNEADKIIPPLLGDPRFSYAKYDIKTLIYTLRVVQSFDTGLGQSIFEKSLQDEKERDKERNQEN